MLLTKEHYDMMARFEANYKNKRLDREAEKTLWAKGYVYADGHVNELFLAYRNGYALGSMSGAAAVENERLRDAIQQTLDENRHLADGDNCTLIVLKRAFMGSNA